MKLSKILRLLLAAALVLSAVMVLASCEGDALVFGDYDFNDVDDHNPQYADKVYTVSFNSDGADAVEPQSIGRGGKATAPADPVKLGYVFEGWYYQSIKWDFDKYTVRSDITLTAKWTKNNTVYSVSFNTLGGTVIPSQNIKEGHYVLLPDTPVLAEHRFGGWYLGDEPWDFSTPVAGNMTLPFGITEDEAVFVCIVAKPIQRGLELFRFGFCGACREQVHGKSRLMLTVSGSCGIGQGVFQAVVSHVTLEDVVLIVPGTVSALDGKGKTGRFGCIAQLVICLLRFR